MALVLLHCQTRDSTRRNRAQRPEARVLARVVPALAEQAGTDLIPPLPTLTKEGSRCKRRHGEADACRGVVPGSEVAVELRPRRDAAHRCPDRVDGVLCTALARSDLLHHSSHSRAVAECRSRIFGFLRART